MEQRDNNDDKPRALDVEIIEPDRPGGKRTYYYRARNDGQQNFGGYFASMPVIDGQGCLAPAITAGIFLVCIGQYGLLAAIGFGVFYLIGALMGTLRQARQMMAGLPVNPWAWRVGNWIISFLITVWLAGGLHD